MVHRGSSNKNGNADQPQQLKQKKTKSDSGKNQNALKIITRKYAWAITSDKSFFLKKKKRLDKIVEYFCFAGKILLNFIFTFIPFISISLPQTAIAIIWPLTFVNLPIQLQKPIIIINFLVRIELLSFSLPFPSFFSSIYYRK